MKIAALSPQLRTTDLAASIAFYRDVLGFAVDFVYADFYAGIRAGDCTFHLKHVDAPDPSIADVDEGGHFHLYFRTVDVAAVAAGLRAKGVALVAEVHETAWSTREFVIHDDQGHTLYFGEPL